LIAGAIRSLSRPSAVHASTSSARTATLALSMAFAAAASGASAEALDASVGCRDGAPNGAYELRGADGRLRVAGAFAKGHRTGTFVFWNAKGARIAVIPYDNDDKIGTVALWYVPRVGSIDGRRKLEAPYAAGRRHGVTRSWHDNGRPRVELRYEQGMLAEARAWRPNGNEVPERDARMLAERDAAADDAVFAELESIVAAHLPACEESPPHGALTLPGDLG